LAKRIVTVLVVALLVTVLTANLVFAKVTIRASAGRDYLWPEFNEVQDEIEVIYEPLHGGTDELKTRILAGVGPDMFDLHGWETADLNQDAWMRDGLLLDLSPFWERDKKELEGDRWFPFIIPMSSYKGKLTGIPIGWSIFNTLNYNVDLFEEVGILYPDDTWTWDTLFKTAKKFVRVDSEGRPVQWGLYPADFRWWTTETMIWSAGGRLFNEAQTGLALNTREARRAMDTALRFITEEAAIPGSGWHTGNKAMRMAAIHWATADKRQAKIPFEAGIAVTPRDVVTGERRGNMVELTGLTGINSATKHPEETWTALKWMFHHFHRKQFENEGFMQFFPPSLAGVETFFAQGPEALGHQLLRDLETVIYAMAPTARLREPYVNPLLIDVFAEAKIILDREWWRVINLEIPIPQFIENVSSEIEAKLTGR